MYKIVVATVSQAITPTLTQLFQLIHWLLVEELGPIAKREFAALTALYDPYYATLIGDTFQLALLAKLPREAEYFRS